MKYTKLMKERIRRVNVIFKELGYELGEGEMTENTYTSSFDKDSEFRGGFFIDDESKFLEIAFTFAFSPRLVTFIQERLEEMLKICYEYGCYMNIQKFDDFNFSVFSKVYFAGLNYYSLKETLKDFLFCIDDIKEIIEINSEGQED
ncbi:MAG: hypothetical protein JEZ04_08885 [Spirochaetales bacterium]|nr:hypothetical protein [Spirochaetales bacterium]